MFFREISELDSFFKTLDRLNVLVFNVWHDKNAEAFKNGDMHLLESFYRNYISEMRDLANELTLLQKQVEESRFEMERLEREIREMKYHPSIEGCSKVNIIGTTADDFSTLESFAISFDERSRINELAYERARRVVDIEKISLAGQL